MEQLRDVGDLDIDSIELLPVDSSTAYVDQRTQRTVAVEMHDYIASHPKFIVNGFL